MGEITEIAWTDHTFNPWIGCTNVSPGCDHCYAEAQDHRWGHDRWGKGKPRELTSEANWRKPLQWDKRAQLLGRPARVFCASLADVFDSEVEQAWRLRLFDLIARTPHLQWQLLTKRPHNIAKMLPADWGDGWPNVWLGTTVEDQKHADLRIPVLLKVPARVRFLSCEPLLGPVDLTRWIDGEVGRAVICATCHQTKKPRGRAGSVEMEQGLCGVDCPGYNADPDPGQLWPGETAAAFGYGHVPQLHWVICGGESGHGARPFDLTWARRLVAQAEAAGVSCFVKQLGSAPSSSADRITHRGNKSPMPKGFNRYLNSGKGSDPAEWPEDLRVRQFPEAS